MVVLDLLDLGSPEQVSASAANINPKPPANYGVPGCFGRGDVVFAKYGNTNNFYWAKVKKVYKNSIGEHLCDVGWLRPQAGVPVEKSYVLHDGYDETLHGDGLKLSQQVRRPCPNELTAAAPPGAASASSATTVSKGVEMADLLGELIVEKTPEQESISSSTYNPPQQAFGSSPLLSQQPALNTNMFGSVNMQPPGGPLGYGWLNSGPNVQSTQPWATGFGQQVSPSPWNVSPATQQSRVPQHVQSAGSTRSTTAAAPFNELQAAFAGNLLLKSSEEKRLSSSIKVSQTNQDKHFDFISDMMSGALMGSESS